MRKPRKDYEEEPLNLVPIMNLVTILIPFLLLSAQFVTLAVIDSTLPAITEEVSTSEPPPEDEAPLGLSILITGEGFTLTGKNIERVLPKDDAENGQTVACLETGCPTPESYDYQKLTEKLVKLRDGWPDEENVILVPDGKTPYEVVVLTMDAAREDPNDRDDQQKARELYPYVVIAAGVN